MSHPFHTSLTFLQQIVIFVQEMHWKWFINLLASGGLYHSQNTNFYKRSVNDTVAGLKQGTDGASSNYFC